MATTEDPIGEFRTLVSQIRMGGSKDAPRPHKPLLLLVVLKRLDEGRTDVLTYLEAKDELVPLLEQFGSALAVHPEQPFWRLQRDGLWEIAGAADLPTTRSGDVHASALTDAHPGRLPVRFSSLFVTDPQSRRHAIALVASLLAEGIRKPALRALNLS